MQSRGRDASASAPGGTYCQLQHAPAAVVPFTASEQLGMRVDRKIRRLLHAAGRVLAEPTLLLRKARDTARVAAPRSDTARAAQSIPRRHSPPLAPGDRVRVRARAEIDATLDENGTCDGMTFLDVVMEKYCGRTFVVRRRIDRFFDERHWRMLKLKDAVILDGAFCEPPKTAGVDWAGCDRSCFLFWKEAWLERVTPDEPSDA